MAGQGKAVVKKATDAKALSTALQRAEKTLISFLGTPEMARRAWHVAYVLVKRTPGLQACSVESIVDGMLQSAQLGLELGTEAYLVPFKNEAAFIPDWKGLVRLAIRAGSLTTGHGDLVYKGDEYVYERTGEGVVFRHVRERFGQRAKDDNVEAHVEAGCQGVYFIGYCPNGPPVVGEMPVNEIEYVRNTYSKAKGGDLWTKRWSAAAIKTVTKQALKLVPMSPKLQQAIELDNRFETGIESAVLRGDEERYRPFKEPQPAKQEPTEEDVRAEDAKLAQEGE